MTQSSNSNLEVRLALLGNSLAADPAFVQRVLDQIKTQNIRPAPPYSIQLRHWIMRGSIGLAAGILLIIAIASIYFIECCSAYAIDGVAQRVLSLDSLHLKGIVYVGGYPHPIVFAQQPDRCRLNGHIDDSGPNGIVSTDQIITADQRITLFPDSKTAMIEKENPEDAREQVAHILQNQVQLMFGAATNFNRERSETLNGIQTDVYESRLEPSARVEIWFNPKTGLPVKTVIYHADAGQPERPLGQFDTIDPNPKIDPAVFNPTIPPDYKIIHPVPALVVYPESTYGGCTVGHLHFCTRLLIALDNGNVLACWALFDDQNPTHDLDLPNAQTTMTIQSTDGPSFAQTLLHADPTPIGYHWRWSLLRPAKPLQNPFALSWTVNRDKSQGQNINVPTTYKPQDLPDRVIEFQKQTLPPGGNPMTLQEIEKTGTP